MIDEVDGLGGMTKAVAAGMPKAAIEQAAAAKPARIDKGEDVIVGVNKYRLDRRGAPRHARYRQPRGPRCADRAAQGDQGGAR